LTLSTFDALYSLSVFLVGALVGITTVGGGSLITPLLVLLFCIHPATAVGTHLLYAAVTKAAGTAVDGMDGRGPLARRRLSCRPPRLMLRLTAGIDRKSVGANTRSRRRWAGF
jgi:hypothetical protein